ncbi:MAG: hypothetical protein MJ058_01705 [Akkermansia sp.]|nr:hypothetical protein [Akkermansia sp.]
MKLHLNATLRAALIAAITAVGMAMPQTFAESKALTVNPTEKTSGNVNMSWTGGDTTLNSWLLTFDLKVTNSGAANFFAISTNTSVASAGWDLGINGTNLLLGYNGTDSPVVTLTDAYTLNTAQAVTFQFVRDVDEDGASLGTGTFTVTANGQTGTYKVSSLTDTALVSGSKAHIWTNGGKQQMTNITLTQLDDNKVVVPTSVWTGTDGNNTWEAGNFDPAFAADGNVKFTADGFDTVVVNSAVSAGKMSVEGAAYTFEIEDGGSLSAAKANIADGASLTVVGGGTATITSLSGAGDLTVGKAGTATVNGLNSYTGELGVTDGGTLNLGSNVTLSELTVADGTVTTQHASGSGVVANTLTIGEGGTFKVIGSHDAFGYNNGATKEIVMQGREDAHATLALEQNSTNSVTMTTNITMHGYSDITVKDGGKGFNTYGCNITVDGVENSIAVIDLRNAVSINVGKGELSVGKFTRNGTSTAAVTKTGEGIMTIEEASTLPGTLNINEGTVAIKADTTIAGLNIATTGSLTVAGGTTSVSGSTNVIGNVIELEAGTLSLAGAYDINSLSSSSEPRYIGGDGIGEGSGFKEASGVVQVVNITDGATLTQVEGVTFTYGADSGTLNEQGAFELSGAVDYTTLYVNNTERVSYTSAWDLAQGQGEEISSVVLANGTAIDADMEDASIALSLTGAEGTVNATEATTISSVSGWSGNKLIITGGADVSLTPGRDIVIGAGSSLEVGTAVAAQKIQLNGAGANLKVAAEGELNLSNNLTLTNGVADVYGTLNVGHEVDLSNGSKATGTLHIHDGGEVTVADGMWMATSAVGVLLEEDATYAIEGKGVSFTGKNGGGSIKAQNAEVNYTANNANAAISNVTMTATADITIANTLTDVDVVTGEHAVSLNAAADSVTVGTDGSISFGTSGSTAAITVENGGTIGSYTKTNEGETTITSVGTAILADTINLQTGKITMTGKYDIDSLYGDVEITGYEGGTVTGNGFAHETGTVQVVDITEGAELDSDSATFLRGGSELTLTDGATTVDGTNYAGFYINSGEETLTQAKSAEIPHETPLSFIYVKDGGTLQVDDDMDGELVYGEGAGIVNIQEDKTVTGAMEGVTLVGKGTYDLGSTAALGTGTTLGQDWAGVVSLSNLTKADGNSAWINGLAQGDSWVEFSNFTGYDRAWASTFVPAVTANIILTDDGEHAAWNLTSFASSTYTMVISGDVKGDGTFKTSGGTAAQSQAIEFQGDISKWEGAFVADANGMRRVVFTGDASTVNASIAKQGAGALNLVVGNGSEFDAVFHEEVSVTSVEVKANASATFLGQLTTSTVTNAGTIEFNALSGLTQAITNSGEVIFNEGFEVSGFHVTAGEFGYFDKEGNFSVDGNGYAGTSDSYITIVNGGSVNADEITVTQDGTGYTMSSDGRALADDGGVTDEYTYHVNTGTVSTSEIDGGTATSVEVAGGTLDVDQFTDLAITVTGEATVTGDALDVAEIGIEGGATAYFGDMLEMSDGGVEFQSAEGGSVGVYNDGDTKAYDLDNRDMEVSAHSIVKTTGEDATVSNWLNVDKIVNVQDATLTLDGLGDAVSVKNITVGQEGIVEILDHESGQEATVTITEELAAGNGTLLANLEMANDSALLVDGAQKALHVGSTLTMGQNIALDGTTLQALDDLAIGEFFWLINAAEGRELVYEGPTGDDAWYDSVFSRTAADGGHNLEGDFNIVFSETDGFGLKKFSNTPEPTTGTLSLLALMALAARRRKH